MYEDNLRIYYNYLYPFETIVKWLTYNNTTKLCHRELSFEYEQVGVERYVKFIDATDMKKRMTDRHSKTPIKVDAGAIWDKMPAKDSNGKTIERQLIFDFDMNDYDDVRTCCFGKTICSKCWKFMIVAAEILERSLKEDFDFHKIMYVFSGGRGLHLWVCDKKARKLKDSVRKAIVDYLELVTGNVKASSLLANDVLKQVSCEDANWKLKGIDPTNRNALKQHVIHQYMSLQVEESLKILEKYQMDIFTEQDILTPKICKKNCLEKCEKQCGKQCNSNCSQKCKENCQERCKNIILQILNNRSKKLEERVKERWEASKDQSTTGLFKQLVDQVQIFETVKDTDYPVKESPKIRSYKRLTFVEEEILLSFLYPRMDFNVSTSQNHLLKLPFSVHPKSNKISIPLFKREGKDQIESFKPELCIKHRDLLTLLQEYQSEKSIEGLTNQQMARKTLLREPIEAMEEFIESMRSESDQS